MLDVFLTVCIMMLILELISQAQRQQETAEIHHYHNIVKKKQTGSYKLFSKKLSAGITNDLEPVVEQRNNKRRFTNIFARCVR